MHINDFINLISSGFDVSFNFEEVFYTISLIKDDKKCGRVYGIGADNGFKFDFDSINSIPNFALDGTSIKDIVESLSENEIFY